MGKLTDFLKSDSASTTSRARAGSVSSSSSSDSSAAGVASRRGAAGVGGGAVAGGAVGAKAHRSRKTADVDGDGLDDRSTGNMERKINANGDFPQAHSSGHPRLGKNVDLSKAEQTYNHLAPVTHEQVKHHETEEVLREREKHDHHHHIKHAVVPVHDRNVREEVHHNQTHAPTRIDERHVNSAEDHDTFNAIGSRHKDTTTHHDKTHQVVDLGERVRTVDHQHVHNVVQPVIERETHDRHVRHTTIPIHHTTHQAPIVHDSVHHSPISMDEFTKRGGKLDSTTTHSNVGKSVLASEQCERKVDGPAEGLMSKLGLK